MPDVIKLTIGVNKPTIKPARQPNTKPAISTNKCIGKNTGPAKLNWWATHGRATAKPTKADEKTNNSSLPSDTISLLMTFVFDVLFIIIPFVN